MPLILLLTLFLAFSFASEETEALRAVRLGCDKQKVALGCYNYANFLLKSGDSSTADSYFEKGCGLGHEPSCKKEAWETKAASFSTKTTEFVENGQEMVTTESQVESDGMKMKVSSTITKNEANENQKNRQDFNKALEACKEAKFEMKHPMVQDFTIVETIHGMENDKCKYTQTMPNNGLMSCKFDEAQRQAFAQDQMKMQEYGANTDICEITGY